MGKRMDILHQKGDKPLNRFGDYTGTPPNGVLPGKLKDFRTLLESLDDGTDLGFAPKDQRYIDSDEAELPDEDALYEKACALPTTNTTLPSPGPYYPYVPASPEMIKDIILHFRQDDEYRVSDLR